MDNFWRKYTITKLTPEKKKREKTEFQGEKNEESWQRVSSPKKYLIQLVSYKISTKFPSTKNPNVI